MNHSRTVRELNACMCGQNCEPALRHPWTVRIPFAENQNLLVFCANTKRTECAGCPFHALDVLCSPQVCGKLINHMPLVRRIRTVQCVSGALVYTKLYMLCERTTLIPAKVAKVGEKFRATPSASLCWVCMKEYYSVFSWTQSFSDFSKFFLSWYVQFGLLFSWITLY